jgi:hypothetical protein
MRHVYRFMRNVECVWPEMCVQGYQKSRMCDMKCLYSVITNVVRVCVCVCVTCNMCIGLSEFINHTEQSTILLGAYVYTKLQTQWNIQCRHRRINSLSQIILHSHCSITINIFTVVMLGFWWCQFCTGSLVWGLCLWFRQLSFLFCCLFVLYMG